MRRYVEPQAPTTLASAVTRPVRDPCSYARRMLSSSLIRDTPFFSRAPISSRRRRRWSERSDHNRGVEARQLDDGIGGTLVSFVCFESMASSESLPSGPWKSDIPPLPSPPEPETSPHRRLAPWPAGSKDRARYAIAITPEAWRRIHCTMVSVDPLASVVATRTFTLPFRSPRGHSVPVL